MRSNTFLFIFVIRPTTSRITSWQNLTISYRVWNFCLSLSKLLFFLDAEHTHVLWSLKFFKNTVKSPICEIYAWNRETRQLKFTITRERFIFNFFFDWYFSEFLDQKFLFRQNTKMDAYNKILSKNSSSWADIQKNLKSILQTRNFSINKTVVKQSIDLLIKNMNSLCFWIDHFHFWPRSNSNVFALRSEPKSSERAAREPLAVD